MLIYHFGSREQLMETLLQHLSERLKIGLEQSLPPIPMGDRDECVARIMAMLRTPAFRRFNAVWFEILASAAAGQKSYRDTGQSILAGFAEWLEARVPANESNRSEAAWALLSVIEGLVIMDARSAMSASLQSSGELITSESTS